MDSISKKYGDYKYFSFLEEKDLDKLKDISIKKTYKKDEILFYKGDESKYLHLLVSGIVITLVMMILLVFIVLILIMFPWVLFLL